MFISGKIIGSTTHKEYNSGGNTMAISLATLTDYTFTKADTLDLFDYKTNSYVCTLDEMPDVTIGHAADTDNIVGKGGDIIKILKTNKSVTLSGTSSLISHRLLEYQIGATAEDSTAASVLYTDYLDVNSDSTTTLKLSKTIVTGTEPLAVVVRSTGNGFTSLSLGDTAEKDKTYKFTGDTLTFAEGQLAAGDTVTVKYKIAANPAVVMDNSASKFSKDMSGFLTLQAEDICNNIAIVEFYFPRLSPSDTFDLAISTSHTTHPFSFSALRDACLKSADDTLYRVTIYGQG